MKTVSKYAEMRFDEHNCVWTLLNLCYCALLCLYHLYLYVFGCYDDVMSLQCIMVIHPKSDIEPDMNDIRFIFQLTSNQYSCHTKEQKHQANRSLFGIQM